LKLPSSWFEIAPNTY